MLENIKMCKKCKLHTHQQPLFDLPKKNAIMVVGLSAKVTTFPNEIPLDNKTKSGHLVMEMEKLAAQHDFDFYRTNLVKCPPLDSVGKLQYPTHAEINTCFQNIITEISELNPPIIILFGNIVQTQFERWFNLNIGSSKNCTLPYQEKHNRCFVASYHPSYIMRSNARVEQYIKNFSNFLDKYIERKTSTNEKPC